MSAWAYRRYAAAQTLHRIHARPLLFVCAWLAASAALLVPMLAATLVMQMEGVRASLTLRPEISVFVTPGTSTARVQSLGEQLKALPIAHAVTVLTAEDILGDLTKHSTPERAKNAIQALAAHPLPDIWVIAVSDHATANDIDATASHIKTFDDVDSVAANTDWYRKWSHARGLARWLALILGSIVVALTLWVLISTVRMQASHNHDETELLRWVGADARFVRRPYVYMGATVLMLAAGTAAWVAYGLIARLRPQIDALLSLYGIPISWQSPNPVFYLWALLACGLIGGSVAALGIRRPR